MICFQKVAVPVLILALTLGATAGESTVAQQLAMEPETRLAVRMHQGVPTPFLNDRPVNMMLYSTTGLTERQIRHIPGIRAAGIHYYQLSLNFYEFLQPDGTANLAPLDDSLKTLLEQDADGYVMIRMYLAPPGWWQARHADQRIRFTRNEEEGGESAASQVWLADTVAMIQRYVKHVENSPYGKRVIGYQLGWGVTGEWHYPGFELLPDAGPAMTARFRQWLASAYGPRAEFATTRVPNEAERNRTHDGGIFRDPASPADRRVADYYRCQHETIRDAILAYSKAAKAACNGQKLIGVFYGYYFHMGYQDTQQAEGGHLCIADILASSDVDFLSGPYSYQHESRKVGGDGCLRGLTESIKLHGKLFFTEADEPTYLGCSQGVNIAARSTDTPAGSIAAMQRNFCNAMVHGTDLWWFDIGPKDAQGGLAGGWWDVPDLQAVLKQLKTIGIDTLNHNRASVAQVAVVCNPETYYFIACYSSGKDRLTHPLLHQTVRAMFHAGAPFDLAMARDLDRLDHPRYKAYVFLDTFYLTPAERQAINTKIKTGGRSILWVYAPGYVGDTGLSVEAMSELTGLQMTKLAGAQAASVVPMGDVVCPPPWSRVPAFGLDGVTVAPAFAVTDPAAQELGAIAGTQECGLASREFPTWTSLYTFAPPVSPEFFRAFYQTAGVHIYDDANDVLYVDASYVAITGESGGSRTLRLPAPADVKDLFSGATVAANARDFSFDFAPKSTRLFLLTPAARDVQPRP
jgi:hypothetical protein